MRINQEGAKAISKMLREFVWLKNLNLEDTGLDGETLLLICEGISDCINIEKLDLKQNIFSSDGLKGLINALKTGMSIKSLYLESILIHINEAKLISSFLGDEKCCVEELEFNEAEIDQESLSVILEALFKRDTLRRLSLAKNEMVDELCMQLS